MDTRFANFPKGDAYSIPIERAASRPQVSAIRVIQRLLSFMRSILEEFAYGNISPENQYFGRNSEYGQAIRAVSGNEEKLLRILDGEEKILFQKYVDAQGEVN